jgi:4-amino-4-deoxy-L-arabinose transferase-like glycosyltransferase
MSRVSTETRTKYFYLVAILLAFFLALYFGVRGVDYGAQWDPNNIKGLVNKYVRTGNILPGEYVYPPGSSYIAATTLIPYALPLLKSYGLNWTPTQHYLLETVLPNSNLNFLLNLRSTFVFFTMLGVIWVGMAAGRRSWLAGVVAAFALGLSWEVSYQSRILHPDGPNMAFVALAILFAMLGYYIEQSRRGSVWFVLAVLAVAAATATKYTSGFSLFIVLVLAFAKLRERGLAPLAIAGRLAALAAIYAGGFLLLVPGAILERDTFIRNLQFAQRIYAGGYGLQTVNAGWDYFSRELTYLFQAAFSHSRVLAVVVPILWLVGAYSLLRSKENKERWLGYALFVVPLVYILYLSTNRALFVRNLLIVFPSIAILAGFGFTWLLNRLSARPALRYALIAAVLAVAAYNIYWLNYTVQTIRTRHTDAFAAQAVAAITAQSDKLIYVTPVAHRLLGERSLPSNATLNYSDTIDLVLFAFRGDTRDEDEAGWPVNFPGASPRIFGPLELNFDWYAAWPGAERLVLSAPRIAWQDSAPLARVAPASPADLPAQEFTGELDIDGEQFFFQLENDQRLFLLNAASPPVVLALRDLIGQNITITGQPYSENRVNDWFVLAVQGKQIQAEAKLLLEYNSNRYLANRSDDELACISSVLEPATYQALLDSRMDLIDLTADDLTALIDCTG